MDQFEYTKIAASILLPLLVIFGFKAFVDSRMASVVVKPGFVLPGGEPATAAAHAEGEKAAAGEKPRSRFPGRPRHSHRRRRRLSCLY